MTKIRYKRSNRVLKGTGIILGLIAVLALGATPAMAADAPTIKIGLVTFLSGGAAGPFGIPGRNGAELMIEAINAGKVPAPYNTKGVAGIGNLPDSNSMLVSGDAKHGGTCFGDSGGPVFLGTDSNVIGAVTSFGLNGNCAGVGGAFRIDRAIELGWISSFL